jgi:acetyl esterase/lipase
MQVGTGEGLIDAELVAYVEESRAFYAARAASRGTDSPPDHSTPEGLQEVRALEEARAKDAVSAMAPWPPVVEALAQVAGRTVPVRILAPESGTARGSLDILLEDNLVMAARLSAAGGAVDVRVYPESPHGFTLHPTAMASAALEDIESWLVDRLLDA